MTGVEWILIGIVGAILYMIPLVWQVMRTSTALKENGFGLLPPGKVDPVSMAIACLFAGVFWWICLPIEGFGRLLGGNPNVNRH